MASLAINTCIDPKKFGKFTIPQIEALFQGFDECNASQESNGDKETMKGADAMQFLIDNGGKL